MYSKLNLKLRGFKSAEDLKLLEDNLNAYSGIKSVQVAMAGGEAEIKIQFDANAVSKQQVFDLIKISGDFQAKEWSPEEVEKKPAAAKEEKPAPAKEAIACATAPAGYLSASNLYIVLGALAGFAIMSLIINIVLGYLVINPIKTQANAGKAAVVQAAAEQPATAPSAAAAPSIQTFNITKDDHVRGDFEAPITLVEYSDFECPFCAKHYPTMKKLLSEYSGQVRLIYKHFPLGFHPNAQNAAEASECADEQGKFWEYHDKLFEEQSGGFSLDNFKQWAKDLKLNTKKFNDCFDSDKYTNKVLAEEADGQNRGINGTPATFVNGQLVSGAVPYESFKSAIDQILSNQLN